MYALAISIWSCRNPTPQTRVTDRCKIAELDSFGPKAVEAWEIGPFQLACATNCNLGAGIFLPGTIVLVVDLHLLPAQSVK